MESKIIKHGDNIFSVLNFWDIDLCEAVISQVEDSNLFPLKETVINQRTLDENLDSRDAFKIYIDNEEITNSIYECLCPYLNNIIIDGHKHSGIHPQLRVYKYLPGQEFKKHTDGCKVNSEFEKSYYSLLIYLNDEFKGGFTTFDTCEIIPKQGQAIFFPHNLEHSGTIVNQGVKYVLRGNIMFKKNK